MKLAPEGRPILVAATCLGVLLTLVVVTWAPQQFNWLAVLSFSPLAFGLWFFRDPVRQAPDDPGAVVAPADGKIIEIEVDARSREHAKGRRKVSIFMSPFNVHVNRVPVSGVIAAMRYSKGKFLTAFHEKASLLNEQQVIEIESSLGRVGCVQIAGWLARRIVCHLEEGQRVRTGERFGMIRFGSRLDVYVPSNCRLQVTMGQRVTAGETVIGVLHEKN
jgi:phosphatidylserine decarboxylase